MSSSNGSSFSRRKQLVAVAVAAVLLTVIYVPFQSAQAATVDFTTDGSALDSSTIPKSGIGTPISIEITLSPGEELDSTVPLPVTISPGTPSGGDSEGEINLETGEFTPTGSTPASLLKDIVISPPPSTVGGGPYSYAVYGIVDGWVGPLTITIDATLKTAFLHQGSSSTNTEQTLTVDVDGNLFNVAFNVTGATNVATENVAGTGTKTITTGSGKTITIKPGGGNGTVIVSHENLSNLTSIFDSVSGNKGALSIGTSDLFTVGDPIIIDVEGLTFPIDVTIPYDPDLLPDGFSESDVRFLHYDEDTDTWEDVTISRNPGQNTVTGRLTSLSPVVAGVDEDDEEVSTGGGGGGGGGRGGGGGGGGGPVTITWPKAQTFGPDYFINYPLQRVLVANSAFLNAGGVSVDAAQVGQQVSISGEFTNQQETSQSYAFIVQVTDENDVVTNLSWQQGTLESGSTVEVATLWTPDEPGDYEVKIFVWNSITGAPEPLSEVTVKNIAVS